MLDIFREGSKKQVFAMDRVLLGSKSNSMMRNRNYFYLEDWRNEVGLRLQLVKNQKLLCYEII